MRVARVTKMSAWSWGMAANFTAWSASRSVEQVTEVGVVDTTEVPALLHPPPPPPLAGSYHRHWGTASTAGQA